MTPRKPPTKLRLAFMTAGLVGAGLMTAVLSADAQQSPQPQQPATTAQTPATMPDNREQPKFSAADRAAFFDARVAAIHAGLQLNADQEKLWPPVETAMRDFAKFRASQRETMQTQPKSTDPVQRLERMSDRTIARGQALKKLADAAGPLYGALSDDQKHRLPFLMHGMHHRGWMHHRMAMMHRGRGGMEGRMDGGGMDGRMGWRHERGGETGGGRWGGWRDRDRGMMGNDARDFNAR